jgi:DNA processing protein
MTTLPNPPVTGAAQNEDRLAWLALMLAPGLGPRRILQAMGQLEAPSRIFSLPLTAIEGLNFPAAAAQFVFDGKARVAAEQEWNRAAEQGVQLVTFGCSQYPERLKEIYDPPPVMWVRGNALICWLSIRSRLLERGIRALTGLGWRRCWGGIFRREGC